MSSEAKAPSTPSPQENEASQSSFPPPMPQNPRRGEVWDVNWSPGRGAEQKGNTSPSYPLTIVASMSRTERELPLHVRIAPTEENGLTDFTDVKCEQVMTIEKSRLIRRRGVITSEELNKVDVALKLSLDLLA